MHDHKDLLNQLVKNSKYMESKIDELETFVYNKDKTLTIIDEIY